MSCTCLAVLSQWSGRTCKHKTLIRIASLSPPPTLQCSVGQALRPSPDSLTLPHGWFIHISHIIFNLLLNFLYRILFLVSFMIVRKFAKSCIFIWLIQRSFFSTINFFTGILPNSKFYFSKVCCIYCWITSAINELLGKLEERGKCSLRWGLF